MFNSIRQCECIIIYFNGQSASAMARLFISHSDRTIIDRVSVSVSRVKKVKIFFCKIQPAVCIKIFCMIFSHHILEAPLPRCYHFMKRFGSRGKIIRTSRHLFMKIAMNNRHPFIIFFNPLLCFYLCLPGPIPVQVKIIMIASSSRPWFIVFHSIAIYIRVFSYNLVIPVYITVPAIGVQTGINDDHRIL